MATTNWSDLNRDGRRLEAIIKHMNTKFWEEKDPDMMLAYLDRILKATQVKIMTVDRVLGVKQLMKGEVVEYDSSIYTR